MPTPRVSSSVSLGLSAVANRSTQALQNNSYFPTLKSISAAISNTAYFNDRTSANSNSYANNIKTTSTFTSTTSAAPKVAPTIITSAPAITTADTVATVNTISRYPFANRSTTSTTNNPVATYQHHPFIPALFLHHPIALNSAADLCPPTPPHLPTPPAPPQSSILPLQSTLPPPDIASLYSNLLPPIVEPYVNRQKQESTLAEIPGLPSNLPLTYTYEQTPITSFKDLDEQLYMIAIISIPNCFTLTEPNLFVEKVKRYQNSSNSCFVNVELREAKDVNSPDSLNTKNNLKAEFIKIPYSVEMTFKTFQEALKQYCKSISNEDRNYRWKISEVR